jgi:hypothetical protein
MLRRMLRFCFEEAISVRLDDGTTLGKNTHATPPYPRYLPCGQPARMLHLHHVPPSQHAPRGTAPSARWQALSTGVPPRRSSSWSSWRISLQCQFPQAGLEHPLGYAHDVATSVQSTLPSQSESTVNG